MKQIAIIFLALFAAGCSPLHISMKEGMSGVDGNLNADFSDRAYVQGTSSANVHAVDGVKTRSFFRYVAGLFQYTSSVDIDSGERTVTFIIKKYGYQPAFVGVDFKAEKGGRYKLIYDWGFSKLTYSLIDMKTNKPVASAKYN